MSTVATAPTAVPTAPARLERRHWLAALAMLFVLFAPYQTLVQTVLTDDAVRKGIDAELARAAWGRLYLTLLEQATGFALAMTRIVFTGGRDDLLYTVMARRRYA